MPNSDTPPILSKPTAIPVITEVPVPHQPSVVDVPGDMTDLELFRKYCMPLGSTDTWKEVPSSIVWGLSMHWELLWYHVSRPGNKQTCSEINGTGCFRFEELASSDVIPWVYLYLKQTHEHLPITTFLRMERYAHVCMYVFHVLGADFK